MRALFVQAKPGADPTVSIEGSAIETFEAELDPATLRPRHSRYDLRQEYVVDGRPFEELAMRDDTFDWDHAEGCGR
jgi:hypothetical protein